MERRRGEWLAELPTQWRRGPWTALAVIVFALTGLAMGQESPKPIWSADSHSSEAYSVCFSSDGKKLASACNTQVKIWDAASGKELLNYPTRGGNVFGLAFSPDGKQLAVSISKELRLVDVETGKDSSVVKGALNFLFRISFSPDGKTVAAAAGQNGAQPGLVQVWEIATGKEVQTLAGHGEPPLAVTFSADGKYLVSGSGATSGTKPGEVIIWSMATGKAVSTLRGHSNNVYGVAISPDGRRVASSSGVRGVATNGELKLWEACSGQEIFRLEGHTGAIFSVAFSPDGRRLASAGADKSVRVWDTLSGKLLVNLPAHSSTIYSLAFSPDGQRLATTGQDRSVKMWASAPTARATSTSLEAARLESLWQDLACNDAGQAWKSITTLINAPTQSVPWLGQKLRPVAPLTPTQEKEAGQWLRDLDDRRFATRDKAKQELARLGEAIVPALRRSLAGMPSAEVRRTVTQLLVQLAGATPGADQLQRLRAVAVLEGIGSAEARQLLKTLAGGVPDARLTEDARLSLERLQRGR